MRLTRPRCVTIIIPRKTACITPTLSATARAARLCKMQMTSRNCDLPVPAALDSAEDARVANPSLSRLALPVGLLLICCFAATYLWCAFRVYQANRFSASRDRASLERAIRLESRDANSYDLLGQYF